MKSEWFSLAKSNMLINHFFNNHEKIPTMWHLAFADFHGINTATLVHFAMPPLNI